MLWVALVTYDWNGNNANSWIVYDSDYPGFLYRNNVSDSNGVRPVITLKTCTLWTSGNGAPETPYEISTTSGC